MRTWRPGGFVAACLFFLAAALPASAQETRGAIEGIVKDGTGGVLPGATITVKQKTTGINVVAVTDSAGSYRFPSLAPGSYTVTAALVGFTPQTFEDLEVGVGRIKTVNVTMNVAGVAVTESVRAESPIVDVKQNAVTQTVSASHAICGASERSGTCCPSMMRRPTGPATSGTGSTSSSTSTGRRCTTASTG